MNYNFNDYEKIQDTLLYLGTSFVLKFNVSLASKDRYGNRKFYYSEYQYQSKYSNYGNVVSIKRQFRFYMTIEEISNFQNNVLITVGDMPMLRGVLTTAARWIQGDAIFGLNPDGQLRILEDVRTMMNLGQNSGLLFEPVIIPMPDGTSAKGIRMSINDEKNYVDMEARNFMAFYEIIRSIDMYNAACSIVSSLPMTHDDASVNRSDIDAQTQEYKRDISKRGTSFFDK